VEAGFEAAKPVPRCIGLALTYLANLWAILALGAVLLFLFGAILINL